MTLNDRRRPIFPWGIESGIRSGLVALLCGIGLIVISYAVSNHRSFQDQISWLVAGIVLLMISMYGHGTLIIRGRRAVGVRRARLISDILITVEPIAVDVVGGNPSHEHSTSRNARSQLVGVPAIERVVVAEGLGLYHVPGCPMVAGRSVSMIAKHVAQTQGVEPCGICLPTAVFSS